MDGPSVEFTDRVLGQQSQDVVRDAGDFVALRSDCVFAYQLAVVVDDAAEGITDVVRGADLLDSTGRQIFLQSLLGLGEPRYMHVPVVTNAAGEKLSKQTFAPALNAAEPAAELREALRFLGQAVVDGTTAHELLGAAVAGWDADGMKRRDLRRVSPGMSPACSWLVSEPRG